MCGKREETITLNINRPRVQPQNRLDPDDDKAWNAPGPRRENGVFGYLSRRRIVVAVVSTLVASGIAASAFNLSGLFNESRLYLFGVTCVFWAFAWAAFLFLRFDERTLQLRQKNPHVAILTYKLAIPAVCTLCFSMFRFVTLNNSLMAESALGDYFLFLTRALFGLSFVFVFYWATFLVE